MIADDSYYITPHEAALAVVATAMKKARLQLDTLIVNSILGGMLFSSGGILCVAVHAENPVMWENNPGIPNFFSGIVFGIGLFYVVIMGADLYNSNILFFSVGVMRRAVSVYDLLVSWSISLIGNIAGSLFVSYVFCHLSGVSTSELWKVGSRQLVEDKASFTFVQTLLKGMAGNFFVCLAIYLQLMAKPLHVKLIVLVLPIFTFVSCGFTHTVADMALSYIGMLNGADVSVGKYIWKLLIPAAVGNAIGGLFFCLVVPFYLHLVVVERDRKRLSLPEYDARDEQPELNVDSRVVRIPPVEEEEEEDGDFSEKRDMEDVNSLQSNSNDAHEISPHYTPSLRSSASPPLSPTASISSDGTGSTSSGRSPHPYTVSTNVSENGHIPISRTNTMRSNFSTYSTRSRKHHFTRSPPGVFPVRGMGEPLLKEKSIENPNYASEDRPFEGMDERPQNSDILHTLTHSLTRTKSKDSNRSAGRLSNLEQQNSTNLEENDIYNVLEDKPGAKLEKAITRLVDYKTPSKKYSELPRTTQDTFPYHRPSLIPTYSESGLRPNKSRDSRMGDLFRTISKQLEPTKPAADVDEINRRLSNVGITPRAVMASNDIAGTANYDTVDLKRPHGPSLSKRNSIQSVKIGRTLSHDSLAARKWFTVSQQDVERDHSNREPL